MIENEILGIILRMDIFALIFLERAIKKIKKPLIFFG